MRTIIPIELKKRCVDAKAAGRSNRDIFDTIYIPEMGKTMPFDTFRGCLSRWSKKIFPDATTLESGTYQGFTAHGATVQVNQNGEIVQAWIKQHSDPVDPEEFIKALQGTVEPYIFTKKIDATSEDMLEIPLFDMHWGIAFFEDYERVLNDILDLITSQHWARIVIPFGQDFFHNDSIVEGRTTKGTAIEKVDMQRAVKDGQKFIYAVVDAALLNANNVQVFYSPGNHDRSISWMFMQVLLERYGSEVVSDAMVFRTVIQHGMNSIMVTHGDAKKASPDNLAHVFPVAFPKEFAEATTREVHSGHLHHEVSTDVYGVMVRRLATGNKLDSWSDKEDLIGAHRRFMLFAWDSTKLKSIYYI